MSRLLKKHLYYNSMWVNKKLRTLMRFFLLINEILTQINRKEKAFAMRIDFNMEFICIDREDLLKFKSKQRRK